MFNINFNFGEKVRKYREFRNVSQLDLETTASLSPGTISRIERGKINPYKETLFSIAKALQLNTQEIVDLMFLEEVVAGK